MNDNGVLIQNGNLIVNGDNVISNLNAEKLQGKTPSDFIQAGDDFGITQDGNTINLSDITINTSSKSVFSGPINLNSSEIKIGNLIIKSSDNGNGILIGIA